MSSAAVPPLDRPACEVKVQFELEFTCTQERAVKTVSLLEFRKKARTVLDCVKRGQSVVLTYRGKPVARLEPVTSRSAPEQDPFYSLDRLAVVGGESLSNGEIDRAVHGS